MGRRPSAAIIGAFVVGALSLAVVGVAIFGSGRLFRQTRTWVMFFDRSVNGLRVGAPVKFKGVQIGSVKDIRIGLSAERRVRVEDIRIPVLVEIDEHHIREKGGRTGATDAEVAEMVEQGLRAQLNTESFVTGVLYVELDFFPHTPVTMVKDASVPYPEIPTLPTTLEQVQMQASRIITKLGEIDLHRLVESLTQAVDGVNRIVNSPNLVAAVDSLDGTLKNVNETVTAFRETANRVGQDLGPLGARLRAASAEAEATLAQLRALVAPGSPIPYQLGNTLQDVSEAARSVRALADYLERNPSALLRGKPVAADHQ